MQVTYLADPDGRIAVFLDRLCRLVSRLEGWPRSAVIEALRRQERRVRDAARLAGISKALLDLCVFRAPEGAERASQVRDVLFRARGRRWPPVPGDRAALYEEAAAALGSTAPEVERLLYADAAGAQLLVRAPAIGGRKLLARYNLELARAVLLDAECVRLSARGGWRAVFRAIKAARLMHIIRRRGRSYEVEITGPATSFIVRPARYGVRLARVVPALAQAPGWRLDADVRRGDAIVHFRLRGKPRAPSSQPPLGTTPRRTGYDSMWERSLAVEFRQRFKSGLGQWTLSRETAPVTAGDELFFPDFTLRHSDGREALVEIVGFWTPEYLESKARKVAAAGLDNLILVVYRGLAVGKALDVLTAAAGPERVVWFTNRPRAAEVVRVAELCAQR